MAGKVEWIGRYHTGIAGTVYRIVSEGGFISLEALDKPYRLAARLGDLEKLLG